MATATKQSPRDTDELEGALLPPVAVPVDENAQLATAAVPVTAFVYDDGVTDAQADIATAPFLPMYQDGESRNQVERQAIAKGKRRGKIEAESEKDEIGKASREQYAKNWHARRQVEVANEEARRRNQQGVQVEVDKYTVERSNGKEVEKQDLAFPSAYPNGYDVAEYETTEYKTDDSYEVAEYKSVYDP